MTPKIQLYHARAALQAFSHLALFTEAGPMPLSIEAWVPNGNERRTLYSLGVGTVQVERCDRNGLRMVRETFRPVDGRPLLAVRLLVTNTTDDPVAIASLTPVSIKEGELCLGEAPVSEWAYMRQPRHKNDMPATAILGAESPALWDAVRGTPETGGVPRGPGQAEWPRRFVSAELTVLTGGGCSALFGFFPLHQQLVQSVLELTPDRGGLARLDLDCLCDGQEVPPGETLVSQWVLVDLSDDPFEAIERYVELLLDAHPGARERRARRRRPPTVWCSWYYYGDGFSQEEGEANLQALVRRPLPIDVFQLDECWDQRWGDWEPNDRWPKVAQFAARVREAGYQAGLWTCPLLADIRSTTRYHHRDWLLRKRSGDYVRFRMGDALSYVLDPTHPEVLAFLEALFRRLTHEWGYTYHKLDFTRAIGDPDAAFYDRTQNRAQAYRRALEAVRRGAGEDAYINVCGGFYGPLIGLADAQRTGSDVRSIWPKAPQGEEAHGYGPFTIKQNTLRYWMNRLWDNDPDALMVRRRGEPYRGEALSLGLMNDTEALTSALNQYLGGGLVCFTENLTEVEDDRLLLLRHCSPSIAEAAIPRDAFTGARFPSLFDTRVRPAAPSLPEWHTLSLVNWQDEARTFSVALDPATLGNFATQHPAFLVSAFNGGWWRCAQAGETLTVGPIPPHGCEVLKVQPLLQSAPCILRTNGHFSMGGTEVTSWEPYADGVRFEITWQWPAPLEVVVAPPTNRQFVDGNAEGHFLAQIDGPLSEPLMIDAKYASW